MDFLPVYLILFLIFIVVILLIPDGKGEIPRKEKERIKSEKRQAREREDPDPVLLEKERVIRHYLEFFKGKTEIVDTLEGLGERPEQYQAMAAMLSVADILYLDIGSGGSPLDKRVKVLIDGIYPIGHLSTLASAAVVRNFDSLDMAIVYSKSEAFPPEIEIGIAFRKPIEVE